MNMCHINAYQGIFFWHSINRCSHLQSRPPRETMGYHGIPRHQPQPTLNAVRRPGSGSFPAGKIMKHLRILCTVQIYSHPGVDIERAMFETIPILVLIFGHFMNISYEST